jgi:segregation and condensation protein B
MTDHDHPEPEENAAGASGAMSLERLSGALAGLFGRGGKPSEQSEKALEGELPEEEGRDLEDEPEEDAGDISPRSILEAMLFVGRPDNAPLTSREAADLMRGVEPDEVDELVEELNAEYREHDAPYEIVAVGAGYRMTLRDEFHGVRERLYGRVRQAKLSQAAIEVLAIVAYNQPITTDELNKLRGTASAPILSQLVRRQLLRIERPQEKPRAPRYYTTDRFLQLFGLRDLDDLPRSQELDKQ